MNNCKQGGKKSDVLLKWSKRTAIWKILICFACTLPFASNCGPKSKTGKTSPEGSKVDDLPSDPFSMLGVMTEQPGDDEFKLRAGPKPPDQVTQEMGAAFPPPEKPSEDVRKSYGELQVLRTQPEGKVNQVAAVTVTFNHPMIPLTSLDQLDAKDAPIRIQPQPPGRVRWLGTTLLAYEAKERFPYSTKYSVSIPKGARSAIGGELKRAKSFEFETPRTKLVSMLPGRGSSHAKPESPIVLIFNQEVDPKEVAARTVVVSNGGKELDLELIEPDGWKSLPVFGDLWENWDKKRTVVLKPGNSMQKNTNYSVKIRAGLGSLEGPLKTENMQYAGFRTYGPLKVECVGCYWNCKACPHKAVPSIRFSNGIRTSDDKLENFINLTPSVSDLSLEVRGAHVYLHGEFQPATTYKISVKAGLSDIYSQEMKGSFKGTIRIKDAQPSLLMPAQQEAVLEAQNNRELALRSINVKSGTVTMVEVTPDNMGEAFRVMQGYYYQYRKTGKAAKIPGRRVKFKRRFNRARNKYKTSMLPMDRILRGRSGAVFVEIHSPDLKIRRWSNPYRWLLVQVTDTGLLARYDLDKIAILSTGLTSGKPKGGVDLAIYRRKKRPTSHKKRVDWEKVWTGKTDEKGRAEAPGIRKLKGVGPYVLVAKKGKDRAFLNLNGRGEDNNFIGAYSGWGSLPYERVLRSHVFTDRDPYRPGDTVHIAGILRSVASGPVQDTKMVTGELKISYIIRGPRGRKMHEGETEVDEDGVFQFDFDSKPEESVGRYSLTATVKGGRNIPNPSSFYHHFQILEYRAPEYKVSVSLRGEPYFYEDKLKATVGADYTFGAPMADADARWTLRRTAGSFSPPGHEQFSFGVRPPIHWSWRYSRGRRGGRYGGAFTSQGSAGEIVAKGEGRLDVEGKLSIEKVLNRGEGEKRILSTGSFTLEAQVFDANRQSIANRATAIVHPAAIYVGLRTKKSILKADESFQIQGVAVDLDGKRVKGRRIEIRAMQSVIKRKMVKKGKYWSYEYTTDRKEITRCGFTSSDDVASCRMKLSKPGYYELDAETTDTQGRKTLTRRGIYVAGKSFIPWKQDNMNRIELVSDKKSYSVGDQAQILIKNPFRRALGILAVEHNGIVEHRYLELTSSTHVENIELTKDQIPNALVSVSLVRGRVKAGKGSPGNDPGRPLFASGRIKLPISIDSRKINVSVEPDREQIRPGESFRLSLKTTDHKGRAVSSRLAVMLVDEGVLSLLAFKTPDPLKIFYSEAGPATLLQAIRAKLLKKLSKRSSAAKDKKKLETRDDRSQDAPAGSARRSRAGGKAVPAAESAPVGGLIDQTQTVSFARVTDEERGGEDRAGDRPVFKTRTKFATTAYFNHQVKTDEEGKAELKIEMPENLTAFRIMVVAMDLKSPHRYGKGESRIKIRKKLLLRPALPRFANFGDRFDAAVVINNETGRDDEVTVKIEGTGLHFLGQTTKKITVPDGRAREVSFRVAPTRPGMARFRFSAIAGKQTDSVAPPPISVNIPATSEAFATYGTTEKSVAQPVEPPKNALPQFGGLNISLSSTALTGLQDAVEYLVEYPYNCSEQNASRLVPIFALGEILKEFSIGKVSDTEKQRILAEKGIRTLLSLQRYDGGFAFWPGSYRSSPYVSVYVTWALLRGLEAGFDVPKQNLQRAARYVQRAMEGRLGRPWNVFWSFRIMAAWVLSEMKELNSIDKGQKKQWQFTRNLRIFYGKRRDVGTFALAWLLTTNHRLKSNPAHQKELRRLIENAAVQTPSGAHFTEQVNESLRLLLHSESRTDAIVLAALMETTPKHILIPKIVRALMSARVKGRWETTQANAFAMHGLAAYFKKYEADVPDFKTHLWLADGYVGTKKFQGRSMKITKKNVPMSYLLKKGGGDLVISKKGTGRLYYRLGMTYAPKSLRLEPREEGFMVSRVYEPVEGKDTVSKDKDGIWRIKAGKYVRVRLTVAVPDRRYYVAVDDPLPAGLEGVDMKLKTSATSTLGNKSNNKIYDFWSFYSFLNPNHTEMRDDRTILFWDRLPSGVYEYTYLARATTTGRFVTPPLKAHEMYHPEVFGRNSTEIVEIVP